MALIDYRKYFSMFSLVLLFKNQKSALFSVLKRNALRSNLHEWCAIARPMANPLHNTNAIV